MMWLFWLFVLLGGLGMGGQALRLLASSGFDLGVALNAVLWLACGVAAVPRVWRLVSRPRVPSSH
jgi:hypothetical protein